MLSYAFMKLRSCRHTKELVAEGKAASTNCSIKDCIVPLAHWIICTAHHQMFSRRQAPNATATHNSATARFGKIKSEMHHRVRLDTFGHHPESDIYRIR